MWRPPRSSTGVLHHLGSFGFGSALPSEVGHGRTAYSLLQRVAPPTAAQCTATALGPTPCATATYASTEGGLDLSEERAEVPRAQPVAAPVQP